MQHQRDHLLRQSSRLLAVEFARIPQCIPGPDLRTCGYHPGRRWPRWSPLSEDIHAHSDQRLLHRFSLRLLALCAVLLRYRCLLPMVLARHLHNYDSLLKHV